MHTICTFQNILTLCFETYRVSGIGRLHGIGLTLVMARVINLIMAQVQAYVSLVYR